MEKYISPLYVMNLIDEIYQKIWNVFESSKYKKVENYLKMWQEDHNPPFWYMDFEIIYSDNNNIDVLQTLYWINPEKIVQIAIDLWIDTPGFIPIISHISFSLETNYKNAYSSFKKAIENIKDNPSISVAMANSSLESIIKYILENTDLDIKDFQNKTLYDLTNIILKKFDIFPKKDSLNEVKYISSSLLNISKNIEQLRSNKTEVHWKTDIQQIITDKEMAYFIVNTVSTIWLFLIQFYENKFKNMNINSNHHEEISIEDIPF